ncbi:MAG: CHAP domain-containing protein [Methylococcaceae bacterium]|nr:CHAP domain-containing protein [Methylococcaceae bacterium]
MSDKDLNAKLKAAAEKMVGGKALTSKYGLDCFALVDKLLRTLGAQTAADGDVPVTATADYDWGDGILLDSIQPGDILQFRKHVVDIAVWKDSNGKWYEASGRTLTRPHHTAIVMEVRKDGSVVVVEQNVHPNPGTVTRNVIPRLDAGEETREVNSEEKIKLKVTGAVRAYRPAPKPPKGASLLHPGKSVPSGGSRVLASFVPSQGGAKRTPGPLGMEVRRPDVIGDQMKKDA